MVARDVTGRKFFLQGKFVGWCKWRAMAHLQPGKILQSPYLFCWNMYANQPRCTKEQGSRNESAGKNIFREVQEWQRRKLRKRRLRKKQQRRKPRRKRNKKSNYPDIIWKPSFCDGFLYFTSDSNLRHNVRISPAGCYNLDLDHQRKYDTGDSFAR